MVSSVNVIPHMVLTYKLEAGQRRNFEKQFENLNWTNKSYCVYCIAKCTRLSM